MSSRGERKSEREINIEIHTFMPKRPRKKKETISLWKHRARPSIHPRGQCHHLQDARLREPIKDLS